MIDELKDQVARLIKSSKFSSNDPFGFSVPIDDVISLPGKFDPDQFLDKIGLLDVAGKEVAVVCPGNGGIVVELINRGAKSVDCYEPDYLKIDSLRAVLNLINNKSKVYSNWPNEKPDNYDYIIVTKGLEFCLYPIKIISDLISNLKKGGTLYLEIFLGSSTVDNCKYNSWRPSKENLDKFLDTIDNITRTTIKVRGDNAIVYKINDLLVVEDGNVNIDKDLSIANINDKLDNVNDVKPEEESQSTGKITKRRKNTTSKSKGTSHKTSKAKESVTDSKKSKE